MVSNTSGPGQTLFEFVRFWSRRWTGAGIAIHQDRGRDVMVTEVVVARADRATTINDVANELGIDQSGASRMVVHAIEHDYLEKFFGSDGRQRLVRATVAGRDLVEQAHIWQESVFAELTRDWEVKEIDQFTILMRRLTSSHQ